MAIDPNSMPGGISPGQGISNTQLGAPPVAGPPPQPGGLPPDPSQMAPGGPPQQPPMQQAPTPPSLIPTDLAKVLAQAINNAKGQAAQSLASYLGNPRGNVSVKNADLLKAWRKADPTVDPLYEKLVNKRSDDEITNMKHPGRRPLIRYGRRTYTEQVEFAEHMAELDKDPRYDNLDSGADIQDDEYVPPQSKFPSRGEETFKQDLLQKREEEREPQEQE